jgi:hypothetical protein
MANPEAYELWQVMKKDPSNRVCIECGASDPQWASGTFATKVKILSLNQLFTFFILIIVNLGTLFCLECSGVHRSLGVHLR